MPFIEWKDAYNIGVERLDEDHRHLVDLVNELHAGITRNRDCGGFEGVVDELQTLLHVLDELIDYAIEHFALEEECMLKHAYPGYAQMKQAHRRLMNMVQDLRRGFDEGQAVSSQKTLESVRVWLETHVLGLDMQFGEFVNKKGIQLQAKPAPMK